MTAVSPLAGGLAAIAGGFFGVAIAKARSGMLGKLREVLAALVATGIGVWRSVRGETFQTWNPPASARAAAALPAAGRVAKIARA